MRHILLAILLGIINPFGLMAQLKLQTATISGTVLSSDKNPIPFAHITIYDKSLGASTDMNGNFTIKNVPFGKHRIVVSVVGFQNFETLVDVYQESIENLAFKIDELEYEMPEHTVIDTRDGLFTHTPGSVAIITSKEIESINPVNGNEVLRRVAGLNLVDEEGLGLRVNIGIRGLDPDRSRNVLVLEDGIPVALSPYGEPELYYSPAMERMAGVEILKGSGSIMHGPQTIGGVVNYITADPPAEEKIVAEVRGGQGGYFSALASYGNTFGKAGIQVTYLHKRANDFGTMEFDVNDLTSKFKFQLSKKSHISVKTAIYNEESNATYVGLTQPMYEAGNQDFVRIAPNDRLAVRRYSGSASHNYYFSGNTKLTTTAFAYTTTRNWSRQDFAYNSIDANGVLASRPSNYTGITWGDESVSGGAIYMRNSTGQRNRQFEVVGAETKVNHKFKVFEKSNDLNVGVRYMYERAFEQRVNGSKADARSGTLRNDEIRTGFGASAFAHNRLSLTEKFSITAGLRAEQFDFERNILRGQYNGAVVDTNIFANSNTFQLIPGAGFNWNYNQNVSIFGGVHRGFAPPRTKDAIDNQGGTYNLNAELSWNYELGLRTQFANSLAFEATAFYMDFSNQIIPVSESSGGAGAGLVNGGQTVHYGLELAASLDVFEMAGIENHSLNIISNFTYVEAQFTADRFVNSGSELVNVSGNYTPYAPRYLSNNAIVYSSESGFGARFSSTFVGKQYTDLINSELASNNGRTGAIGAYHLLDAGISYRVKPIKTTFMLSVKNMLGERYIASRRPQGIRVGMERFIMAGIRVNL